MKIQNNRPRPTIGGRTIKRSLALLPALLLPAFGILPASAAEEPGKVTELLTQALSNIPGKEVTMITVDYAPGATDPVHRHNASAFVYVLEGTIIMQMKGGRPVTLQPGETFYEAPDGVHLVGRNASDTKPARFLVFLIKDKGAPILLLEK